MTSRRVFVKAMLAVPFAVQFASRRPWVGHEAVTIPMWTKGRQLLPGVSVWWYGEPRIYALIPDDADRSHRTYIMNKRERDWRERYA